MKTYSLAHLSDAALLRDCETVHARERGDTAEALAHIAEVDARKAYVPAGYDSMFAYCVGRLRLSDDAAAKRIHAARAARRFPAIFVAVAEGRLHLSAVVLLAPHLTEATAAELLAAADGKRKAEIERLLAERFPRPDMLAWVAGVPAAQHAPGHVGSPAPQGLTPGSADEGRVQAPVAGELQHAPGHVGARSSIKPLSSQSYEVQFTMDEEAHALLREAQELLGHQVASGDVAAVIKRALQELVPRLRQRKFAATDRPRSGQRRPNAGKRHIPAPVKRAVWERDGGQCTFVSEAGHRCEARRGLQFDHIEAFARGGEATVAGIRLRCSAHNQYEAERTFGAGFMHEKRQAAQRAAVHRRAAAACTEEAASARAEAEAKQRTAAAEAAERAKANDVIPWLRGLGFRADEARQAAALCESIPDAPLEQRVRVALTYFHRRRPPQQVHASAGGRGPGA